MFVSMFHVLSMTHIIIALLLFLAQACICYARHIAIAGCPFFSLRYFVSRSLIIVLVRGVDSFGHNHSFLPCTFFLLLVVGIDFTSSGEKTYVFNDRLSTTLILINLYHDSSS